MLVETNGVISKQACLSIQFARTHADSAQFDRQAWFWVIGVSLFPCMVLQVNPVLTALAVKCAAFSMQLCDVHNLSNQTLLEHDSSAACTDCST